jgi:hypothetical protein
MYKKIKIGDDKLTTTCFSSDGKYLAIGNITGEIFLFIRENKKIRIKINCFHKSRINVLLFEDSLLYSASCDKKINLWDYNHDKLVRMFHKNFGKIVDIDKKKNSILVSTNEGIVKFWDKRFKKSIDEVNTGSNLKSAKFLGGENFFATGGNSPFLYLWDLRKMEKKKPFLKIFVGNKVEINSFCVSKIDSLIFYLDIFGNLYKWCRKKGNLKVKFNIGKKNRKDPKQISMFKLKNDCFDKYMSMFNDNGDTYIFYQSNGKIIKKIKNNLIITEDVTFNPNKKILCSGGEKGNVIFQSY